MTVTRTCYVVVQDDMRCSGKWHKWTNQRKYSLIMDSRQYIPRAMNKVTSETSPSIIARWQQHDTTLSKNCSFKIALSPTTRLAKQHKIALQNDWSCYVQPMDLYCRTTRVFSILWEIRSFYTGFQLYVLPARWANTACFFIYPKSVSVPNPEKTTFSGVRKPKNMKPRASTLAKWLRKWSY